MGNGRPSSPKSFADNPSKACPVFETVKLSTTTGCHSHAHLCVLSFCLVQFTLALATAVTQKATPMQAFFVNAGGATHLLPQLRHTIWMGPALYSWLAALISRDKSAHSKLSVRALSGKAPAGSVKTSSKMSTPCSPKVSKRRMARASLSSSGSQWPG